MERDKSKILFLSCVKRKDFTLTRFHEENSLGVILIDEKPLISLVSNFNAGGPKNNYTNCLNCVVHRNGSYNPLYKNIIFI